jgi:hypothetical protein
MSARSCVVETTLNPFAASNCNRFVADPVNITSSKKLASAKGHADPDPLRRKRLWKERYCLPVQPGKSDDGAEASTTREIEDITSSRATQ